jgi:chorismate dehydratase
MKLQAMEKKVRVGAVSYLNTKPLIYGFEQGMMRDEIELIFDHPAKIASALLKDEIDIGLVPVAIIPEMKNYYTISDYGIASDGAVASVCLFSEVPVNEIDTVLLDYQSRTSIELAQILLKEYWKINPFFEKAGSDFRSRISGTTGAIVIGDRAFEQRKVSKYCYDLGFAWKEMTGFPFVFATWVSNKKIEPAFIERFNSTNELGLKHVDEVVKTNPYQLFDLKSYYTDIIHYRLDECSKAGLAEFLKKMRPDFKFKFNS